MLRSLDALFGRTAADAGPNFSAYSSYPATDLTPEKIVSALREADTGFPHRWAEMVEQVYDRDPELAGFSEQRCQDVAGSRLRVVRPRSVAAPQIKLAESLAAFHRTYLDRIDAFDEALEGLLGANAQGWASCEVVYVEDTIEFADADGRIVSVDVIVPRRLQWVHPKHFQFDPRTGEPYLVVGSDRVSLPWAKFIFHGGAGGQLYQRRGFMRQCIWLSAAKSWSFSDWIVFIHRYGVPITMGSYDGELADLEEYRATYDEILRLLGDGRPAVKPKDFEVDVKDPPSGGRASDPHSVMVGTCNAGLAKRIVGAQLAVESGGNGSFAQASIHADRLNGKEVADGRHVASTVRRDLFVPVTMINLLALAEALQARPKELLGCVPGLRFRIAKEVTPEQRQRIYEGAVNELGLEVDEEQYRDEMDIDGVPTGGKRLPGKATQVSRGGALVGSVTAARDGVQMDDGGPAVSDSPPK